MKTEGPLECLTDIPLLDEEETYGLLRKYVPHIYDEAGLAGLCGETAYGYDTVGPTKAIAEPIWEALSSGGKRLRVRLFDLILRAYGRVSSKTPMRFPPRLRFSG